MATVAGQGTTFNLPNYTGELYKISPTDTPFLSAIGGLNGGLEVHTVDHEWQIQDNRASTVNNVALEGAAAPAATNQSRSNVSNTAEIHHSAIEVSYTKQAAYGQKNGINNAEPNPITDELTTQINAELESMAVDIEKSLLSGVYARPANNASGRKTRGILTAITTNVNANGGTARPLSKAILDATFQQMFSNGSKLKQDTTVLMVSASQKVALSNVYGTPPLNAAVQSRNVGGVAVDTIVTDFGTFGVMLNRYMPAGQIGIVDLSVCRPFWLVIPGKGTLFVEPLAKTGSSEKFQLYGEVGLKYGWEGSHGLIKDLT